jgi:uncharacterized protein YbaA (DUF1428 family)
MPLMALITSAHRGQFQSEDEVIVFSRIEWSSKQVRDEAWAKLRADPRMQPDGDKMPFDGQRLIYGGCATVLDD